MNSNRVTTPHTYWLVLRFAKTRPPQLAHLTFSFNVQFTVTAKVAPMHHHHEHHADRRPLFDYVIFAKGKDNIFWRRDATICDTVFGTA